MLPFELDRRQHSVSNMLSLWVVEHFNILENVLPGLCAGFVDFPPDALPLEKVEETFCYSIVVTVTTAAHGVSEIVVLEK